MVCTKQLEQLAIKSAEQAGIYSNGERIFFEAKRGLSFREGVYTLVIPKNPEFAPYIVIFNKLVRHFNELYSAEQIFIRNTNRTFRIAFNAQQFASAFGGIYHPRKVSFALSQCLDVDDVVSPAVLNRIDDIPAEFLLARYVTEHHIPSTDRLVVSDDANMVELAEKIPVRYKHSRARREIRALSVSEISFLPYASELANRFRSNKMRAIFLKSFASRDRFPDDVKDIVVNAKRLALTNYSFDERFKIPVDFDRNSLWQTYGKEIAVAYSTFNLPLEWVHEVLGYSSTARDIYDTLKGNRK